MNLALSPGAPFLYRSPEINELPEENNPDAQEPAKNAMRDKRFVAVHRGGPLDLKDHRLLVIWAAECVERVLPIVEEGSNDERPRTAIEAARGWTRGEVSTGATLKAAYAAHAADREAETPEARSATRTAGQAVATAHFADHSLVAANYAIKTIEKAGGSSADESTWQVSRLSEPIRELVISGIKRRFPESIPNNEEQVGDGQPVTRTAIEVGE